MSKPVFKDVFAWEGRRNRQSYILIQITTFVALVVSILVAAVGIGMFDGGGAGAVLGSALILVGGGSFIAGVLAAWLTSAQRVRDIGYAGPWCLIQLVPYIGWVASLFITFAAGDTKVENKFGPSCIAQ